MNSKEIKNIEEIITNFNYIFKTIIEKKNELDALYNNLNGIKELKTTEFEELSNKELKELKEKINTYNYKKVELIEEISKINFELLNEIKVKIQNFFDESKIKYNNLTEEEILYSTEFSFIKDFNVFLSSCSLIENNKNAKKVIEEINEKSNKINLIGNEIFKIIENRIKKEILSVPFDPKNPGIGIVNETIFYNDYENNNEYISTATEFNFLKENTLEFQDHEYMRHEYIFYLNSHRLETNNKKTKAAQDFQKIDNDLTLNKVVEINIHHRIFGQHRIEITQKELLEHGFYYLYSRSSLVKHKSKISFLKSLSSKLKNKEESKKIK